MPHPSAVRFRHPVHIWAVRLLGAGLVMALGACAQQRTPDYYDSTGESTASDARHRAAGNATTVAPSQIQLGFGEASEIEPPSELADTHTYLGTIPCTAGAQCPANRLTLTLAPDGQWRARSTPVDHSTSARTLLGCWHITGSDPVRIVLQNGKQPYATLALVQPSVLRLVRLNGHAPLLESRLTRQADVDPIDELSSTPAQTCHTE